MKTSKDNMNKTLAVQEQKQKLSQFINEMFFFNAAVYDKRLALDKTQ